MFEKAGTSGLEVFSVMSISVSDFFHVLLGVQFGVICLTEEKATWFGLQDWGTLNISEEDSFGGLDGFIDRGLIVSRVIYKLSTFVSFEF